MDIKDNKSTLIVLAVMIALLFGQIGYIIGVKKQEARFNSMMPRLHKPPMPLAIREPQRVQQRWPQNREQEGFISVQEEVQRMTTENQKMLSNLGKTFWGGAPGGASVGFFVPNMDVKEVPGAYMVTADLPGMKKEDIHVELQGRSLVVSGERKIEVNVEKEGYYRQESNYGNFLRTINLPEDAKIQGITSEYKDGVLTIKIPKTESAKAVKSVPVKVTVQ